MFLHAWRLEIDAPEGAKRLRFEADPGDAFVRFVHEGSERRMTTQSWTELMPARRGSSAVTRTAANLEISGGI